MSASNYGKIVILKMIKDEKELLFGTLTHPVTNEDRHDAWKEIHEKAKSLGIVRAEKTWEYLRDVTWANWKRRTLVKRDGRRKTGTGGGKEVKYTDVDNLVLDIIGRDSPLLRGLNVPESIPDIGSEDELPSIHSSPKNHAKQATTSSAKSAASTNEKIASKAKPKPKVMFRYNAPADEPTPTTSSHVEAGDNEDNDTGNRKVGKSGRKRPSPYPDTSKSIKKQQLQLDLMEIDKRTKAIQLYKLEKKFDLPPSPFTQEFHDAIADAEQEN